MLWTPHGTQSFLNLLVASTLLTFVALTMALNNQKTLKVRQTQRVNPSAALSHHFYKHPGEPHL